MMEKIADEKSMCHRAEHRPVFQSRSELVHFEGDSWTDIPLAVT